MHRVRHSDVFGDKHSFHTLYFRGAIICIREGAQAFLLQ
jgi:hypothetical protein